MVGSFDEIPNNVLGFWESPNAVTSEQYVRIFRRALRSVKATSLDEATNSKRTSYTGLLSYVEHLAENKSTDPKRCQN